MFDRLLPQYSGFRRLAHSPYLTRLRSINLGCYRLAEEGLLDLARSPLGQRLENVGFNAHGISQDGFQAFAAIETPARWKSLRLLGGLLQAGLPSFFQAPVLSELASIRCVGDIMRVGRLARSPLTQSLREIILRMGELDVTGAAEFATAEWPLLHTLEIGYCKLGPDAAVRIASSTGLSGLLSLKLTATDLGTNGVLAVAETRSMPELRELNIDETGCTAALPRVLANTSMSSLSELIIKDKEIGQFDLTNPPNLAIVESLSRLNLALVGFSDTAISTFLNWLRPTRLADLSINPIGPSVVQTLIQSPLRRSVVVLRLNGWKLDNESVSNFLGAEWPHLRSLTIFSTEVSPDVGSLITGSNLLRSLSEFQFHGCAEADEFSRQLFATRPRCEWLELPESSILHELL